jgi:hypothetical protein
MNKATKYHEQLLHYLDRDENYDAMLVWVEEQPELDQPDIFRELAAILKECHQKTGEKDWVDKTKRFEEIIDQFEEELLDFKQAENLFNTEYEKVEMDPEQLELFFITSREAIIENILASPENDKELWYLARKAIKAEKGSNSYDPANWSAIFPL